MTKPKQHHDALFKKTFSDVHHAAATFRAVLPEITATSALLATSYVGGKTFGLTLRVTRALTRWGQFANQICATGLTNAPPSH